MRGETGFTMIELVLVLALISILSLAYAVPIFADLQTRTYEVTRNATVVNINDGIHSFFSTATLNNTGSYPDFLDIAPVGSCVLRNPITQMCFSTALQVGVSRDWTKSGAREYQHTPSGQTFTYNENNGTFQCTGGC